MQPAVRCITTGAGPCGSALGVGRCLIVWPDEAAIAAIAFAFRRSTRSTAYGAVVAAVGCEVLMLYAYRTPPEIARPVIRCPVYSLHRASSVLFDPPPAPPNQVGEKVRACHAKTNPRPVARGFVFSLVPR